MSDTRDNPHQRAVLMELRLIRWLLFFILVMMVTFAAYTLPNGWWYKGWW